MGTHAFRLFDREALKAQQLNETLGLCIGAFQGATNFFLNGNPLSNAFCRPPVCTRCNTRPIAGVVLAVLYGGSRLIAVDELTAGDLMSFLVTSQTIQRSLAQMSIVFGQAVRGFTAAARVFEVR
jgi:ATP-binding cassette subfamily B (MDR/TAP) protein 8